MGNVFSATTGTICYLNLHISPLSLTWIPEKLDVITYLIIEEAAAGEKKDDSIKM